LRDPDRAFTIFPNPPMTEPLKASLLALFGGGALARGALHELGRRAKQNQKALLALGWASREPDEAIDRFECALEGIVEISRVPRYPGDRESRARFLALLGESGGVFFCGGDQNRIMDRLDDDALVRSALRRAFAEGRAFGGTSAGAAIMSGIMIGGERRKGPLPVRLRPGLGLVDSIIVDQHFLKRRRHHRLLATVARHPEKLGLGVDEDAAVVLTPNGLATVYGGRAVTIARAGEPGRFDVRVHEAECPISLGELVPA
jgi:cyanophycinase